MNPAPAPWKCVPEGYVDAELRGVDYLVLDADGKTLASFDEEATANLMAAAPDLLAACIHALRHGSDIRTAEILEAAIHKACGL